MKKIISKEDINFGLLIIFICTTIILAFTTYMFVSISIDLNNVIKDQVIVCGGK